MALSRTRELLDSILAGGVLSASELQQLIDDKVREDQHLDYKSGRWLDQGDKSKLELRRYVSGFANADGGLLIVGVTDIDNLPGAVDGCRAPGGRTPLDAWAKDVVASMAAQLSPPPRFMVISHGSCEVLAIAVARAPSLIAIAEGRELGYWLRIHDTMVRAQDWLLSDLVLGRRQHPRVELVLVDAVASVSDWAPARDHRTVYQAAEIHLRLEVQNHSMVHADAVTIGALGWQARPEAPRPPDAHLLQHIEVEEPPVSGYFDGGQPDWKLHHIPVADSQVRPAPGVFRPFVSLYTDDIRSFRVPWRIGGRAIAEVAIYVIPRGSPPSWFSVRIDYSDFRGRIFGAESTSPRFLSFKSLATVTRLDGTRPRPTWWIPEDSEPRFR